MNCPRTSLILRSLSGELPPSEQTELDRHAAECPVCGPVLADLRQTWALLGAWEVDASGADLAAAVLARAEGSPGERTTGAGWVGGLRVAASIACALGLGIAAGSLLPTTTPDGPDQVAATGFEAADVIDSLGLTDLGGISATGLAVELPLTEPMAAQEVSS